MTDDDLDAIQSDSCHLALIHVSSGSCDLCRLAYREFTAAVELIQDQVVIYEVDAASQPGVMERLNIKAAPALLIYTSGIEIGALLGFYSKDELQSRLWRLVLDRE